MINNPLVSAAASFRYSSFVKIADRLGLFFNFNEKR